MRRKSLVGDEVEPGRNDVEREAEELKRSGG